MCNFVVWWFSLYMTFFGCGVFFGDNQGFGASGSTPKKDPAFRAEHVDLNSSQFQLDAYMKHEMRNKRLEYGSCVGAGRCEVCFDLNYHHQTNVHVRVKMTVRSMPCTAKWSTRWTSRKIECRSSCSPIITSSSALPRRFIH